ncbi:uncharacterized protein LOC117498094 isoform X2 [Trematomus bernacchii]|uniref:uncharacterized protein LOC117498094 isoform X2 n=1 Tax=Trematomus bernacchii TaxID=40690 RepID=UPI00146EA50F|nr:uncharacterized protein LOC117498094 isoform X2 [Trematomus bernacchii]
MAIWNEGNEELLITLIEERPALYDITETNYSNRVVKTGLWREIESQLGFSEKELRKKWDSLRTEYRQLRIMTRLQFLEPYTKRKESTSNLTITAAESPLGGTSSETSMSSTTEESFLTDAEPCTPLAESTICNTPAPAPSPLGERPSTPSNRMTPAKRRMLQDSRDESIADQSQTLLHGITNTLAQLAPSRVNDVFTAHAQVFEHRLRMLAPPEIQPFLNTVDNAFFRHLEGTQTSTTYRNL